MCPLPRASITDPNTLESEERALNLVRSENAARDAVEHAAASRCVPCAPCPVHSSQILSPSTLHPEPSPMNRPPRMMEAAETHLQHLLARHPQSMCRVRLTAESTLPRVDGGSAFALRRSTLDFCLGGQHSLRAAFEKHREPMNALP